MDDEIHALKGSHHTLLVADVADKKAQLILILLKLILHDELLKLVPGVDDDLLRIIVCQNIFGKRFAKGTGSAGYQN